MKELEGAPAAIIEESHYVSSDVRKAQDQAAIRNTIRRHQERMAKYQAWIDPEAMAERREKAEREAKDSLARTKEALGITGEEEPLPDAKDLPPEMRGQAPSTIRAYLRQQERAPKIAWATIENGEAYVAQVIMATRKPWYRRLLDWFR